MIYNVLQKFGVPCDICEVIMPRSKNGQKSPQLDSERMTEAVKHILESRFKPSNAIQLCGVKRSNTLVGAICELFHSSCEVRN